MFAHVEFADGSNPIIRYGNKTQVERFLQIFNKKYDFVEERTDNQGNYFITAEHRVDAMRRMLEKKLFSEAKIEGYPIF